MLPKVPKGFITNFPHAVPDFIGPRQFIFLLSVVSVLILTSFFLITFQNPSQKGHDPQFREKAQSLGNFVKRAFPNDYSMRQFEVPCLDSACGEVSYSTEEVEILNLAEDAQFKDERSKQ